MRVCRLGKVRGRGGKGGMGDGMVSQFVGMGAGSRKAGGLRGLGRWAGVGGSSSLNDPALV